jgi:hypothetical protein
MLGMFMFMIALSLNVISSSGTVSTVSQGSVTVPEPAQVELPETELVAEEQVASGKFTTALEVKPILNATRGSWIAVREYDGQDLIYVTHLWSWRCGLVEMRVGLNGAAPEIWDLPSCHKDQPVPNIMADDDGLPYRVFPLGSVNEVEVVLTYDDLTTDNAKFNRQGVLIP